MRYVLVLLALTALVFSTTGCEGCGPARDPYVKVRLPVQIGSDPVVSPTGFGVVQEQRRVLVPLAAPQAEPFCAPMQQQAAPYCAPGSQVTPQGYYAPYANPQAYPYAAVPQGCN